MTDTNKKTISVTLSHWVIDNVIGPTENRSQRIQELLQKGSMVETLEDATGKTFKEVVQEHGDNKKGSGPTGNEAQAAGSPLRLGKFLGFLNPRTGVSTTSASLAA